MVLSHKLVVPAVLNSTSGLQEIEIWLSFGPVLVATAVAPSGSTLANSRDSLQARSLDSGWAMTQTLGRDGMENRADL